jgi:uncharacterized protein
MKSPLDSQYRCLAELKEIEETAFLVERDFGGLPTEVSQLDSAVATKRADLDNAKARSMEAEKKLRATERELKDKEDALFKAEGKMMEVKTNVEYQAATKENLTQKKNKTELEDKILALITELEEQKKALGLVETEFKTYESGMAEKRAVLKVEETKLAEQLRVLVEKRQRLLSTLEPATISNYQKLLTAKKVPVAFAESGKCGSCHMMVRAQIYNEILGQKAVHRCASCTRLLIVPVRAGATSDLSEINLK